MITADKILNVSEGLFILSASSMCLGLMGCFLLDEIGYDVIEGELGSPEYSNERLALIGTMSLAGLIGMVVGGKMLAANVFNSNQTAH
ncbi:MAG: hypothetical protein NBV63_00605 [Candidatus Pacebacteria bacterium]|nr:hypothetical protein [Candidatus Paceibacterota bacterium]